MINIFKGVFILLGITYAAFVMMPHDFRGWSAVAFYTPALLFIAYVIGKD